MYVYQIDIKAKYYKCNYSVIMEKKEKDPHMSEEIVKLQKHRIVLWCAIIIIAFFLIVQFSVSNCENKILADQFTFASTISSIILSVIAIIMSVVSGESINNLLHKFRDVHDEISDVPDKIDSSIQKMDSASNKFEEMYENLKETPQKIKESTEVMKDISKHVDSSVESLSGLMKEIQEKTENWHLIREELKEIKEGFQNMAFPTDTKISSNSGTLSEDQAKMIYEKGSLYGALILYAVKLAKDKNKKMSLNDLSLALASEPYKEYFYGYFIALKATGIFSAKDVQSGVYQITSYNTVLNSIKQYLLERAVENERLQELIPLVDKYIDDIEETVFEEVK